MKAKWVAHKYGSGAAFRVWREDDKQAHSLGSFGYGKNGYSAEGVFGRWPCEDFDYDTMKARIEEAIRETLESQLAALKAYQEGAPK